MRAHLEHRRTWGSAVLAVAGFAAGWLGTTTSSRAQDAPELKKSSAIEIAKVQRAEPVDFAKEILPILRANCTACHNATDHEADLSVETPEAILKGGESGPAVVAGKGAESLLLQVSARLEKPFMPPKNNKVGAKPLTPGELGLLKLWIDQGAKGGAAPAAGTPAPMPAGAPAAEAGAAEYQPLPEGLNPIYAVAVTNDGQLAACNRANQIFVYSLPKRQLLTRLTDPAMLDTATGGRPGVAHRDLVQSLAFSPDGKLLASGGYREVKLWQRPDPAVRFTLAGVGAKRVGALATSPDGKVLAVAGDDGIVRLFDLPDGKPRAELKGHAGEVTAVRFGGDGSQVFTASADKTVRVWNTADAKQAAQIDTPHPVAALVALEPKDAPKQIVTGGGDNLIRVWPMPGTAGAAREFAGHTGPVTSLAAVPGDAARFVSGGADGTVRQWTLGSANAERQLDHGAPVSSVAVRGDGAALASAGGTFAKLFDLRSGQPVATLKGDRATAEAAQLAERTFNLHQAEAATRKQAADAATQAQAAATQAVTATTAAKAAAEKALAEKQAAAAAKLAAKEAADKALATALAEIQSATQARAAADKLVGERKAAAEAASAKRAELAAASQKAAADALPPAKAAEPAKAKAEAAAAESAAKAKAAADAKSAGDAASAASASAQKAAADAKSAADKQPDDPALKDAAAQAAKAAEEAAAKAKAAADAHAAARKAADEAAKAAEAATNAYAAARKPADDAAAAAKAAADALASSEKSAADAQAALKTANEAKDVAEKSLTAATAKQAPAEAAAKQAATEAAQAATDAEAGRAGVATAGRNLVEAQAGARAAEAQLALQQAESALANAAAAKAQVQLEQARKAAGESEKPVTAVAFAPDGTTVAAGAADGVVRTYAADTGAAADVLRGHDGAVTALAVRADGTVLSGSADRTVKAWDVNPAWTLRSTIGTGDDRSPLADRVLALAFSPDGSLLATGGGVPSRSGELKLWSVATGQLFRDFPEAHSDTVFGLSFSGDGRLLASGAADKFARLWDVATGARLRSFEGHTHHVLDVSLRHDGRVLVTAGADNAVKLWDAQAGDQRAANNAFSKFEVTGVAHVGFTDRFLVTTGDGLVRILKEDLAPERAFDLPAPGTFLYAGAVTPDGTRVLSGGYDSVLRVRDGRDGKPVADLPAPEPGKK